jgi:uncharacterized membrane protein YidH (DUF202 family)
VNDELANDRTYLAWLRTGIACFGLGVIVAKVALIINASGASVPHQSVYSVTGVLIVLSAESWSLRAVGNIIGRDGFAIRRGRVAAAMNGRRDGHRGG